MSTNRSRDIVFVTDWSACFNISDSLLVVSCTVSSADASHLITGIGLLVNNAEGATLASFYNGMSSGSEQVYPAFNLEPGRLQVGDAVWAVVQGECGGEHFFLEEELTIGPC